LEGGPPGSLIDHARAVNDPVIRVICENGRSESRITRDAVHSGAGPSFRFGLGNQQGLAFAEKLAISILEN